MARYLFGVVGLVFVGWTVGTSLTQVQPGERAVVRRFGRILDVKPEQGLYVGWPWGMEQVDRVPIARVRRISVGFFDKEETENEVVPAGQVLTGDHNLVNVQAEIYYKVREAGVEKFVLQADNVEALIDRVAESLLAEWIAGRTVDEVLLRGKIELPRFMHAPLQERLDQYDLGVQIEQASITDLFPPKQVKAAFDRLAQAQTNIRTQVNRAEEEADKKKSEARAEIFRLTRSAHAYAGEERARAGAEAASFVKRLEQYRELSAKNPDYINSLWLDEMTRLFTRMKDNGRIDLLDHHLSDGGLTITQFPLPRKK